MNPLGMFNVGSAVLILGLGMLVFIKRGHSKPRRTFAFFCLSIFGWFFFYGLMELPGPYQLLCAKLGHSSVLFVPVTCLHFVMYFLGLTNLRPVVRAYYVVALMSLVCLHTTDWLIAGVRTHAWGIYPVGGFAMWIDVAIVAMTAVYCWTMFVVRCRQVHRTGSREEYNRLKYGCIAMTCLSLGALDYLPKLLDVEFFPIGFATTTIFAILFTYAILKRQLLDLNIAIRRTVVYSVLVACMTATYLVMVLVMEHWFQGFFGYRSLIATSVVAFLIAIFFNPLRERIQAFVDRALFHATPAELAAQREQLLVEVQKGDQMKAVATLAAGLAHEIKNPLASIKTFTEYLDRRYADPAFRAKFTKIVGGELERINLIVQQLLEFAKPMPPKLQPLEVTRLMDDTLEFLTNELMTRRIELQRDYTARPTILGDPQQLKQVFLNVFLNSLQAMDGDGRLTIRSDVQGSELLVTIADNGTGIAPEDLPHIFDPFFTTKPRGTGLGLAVVQGIIKEHGGRVTLTSHEGAGTTVTLHLPIAV